MDINNARITLLSIADDDKNKCYLYIGEHDKILGVIDQRDLIDLDDTKARKAYSKREHDKLVESLGEREPRPTFRFENGKTNLSEFSKDQLEDALGFKLPSE